MPKKTLALILNYGAAQFFLIIATPLLTRLYSPGAFAYFGYIISFVTIILPLSTLHYEYAIPLLRVKKLISTTIQLCLYIVFISSILILFLCLTIRYAYPSLNIHLDIIFLCFTILILQGMIQIYSMPFISDGLPIFVARGKMIQNGLMIIAQLLLAIFLYNSSTALLLGLIFGLLANLVYYRIYNIKYIVKSTLKISKKRFFFLLKRYYQLPLFSSWANFIESISTLMPILMIGPLYGAKSLGLYFLIYRIFNAPIGLLSMALGKIALKEIADCIKQNRPILSLFMNTTYFLGCLSLCYIIFMCFISTHIPDIFGQVWADSGPVLKVLAPIISLTLCISPLSFIFILLKRSKVDLLWQISYLLATVGTIYYHKDNSFLVMLKQLSLTWIGLYIIYWILLIKVILFRDKRLCVV